MRAILTAAALAALCLPLGGCFTSVGRAAFKDLKPLEVGIVPTMSCSDLIKAGREAANKVSESLRIAGVPPATDADSLRRENTALLQEQARTDAIMATCETRDRSQKLVIDPQAAREALGADGVVPGLPGV